MNRLPAALLITALAFAALLPRPAGAHSASDAYLTLDQRADGSLQGQWDIALRDLDFVLGLDDDGDGDITWAEVRAHQSAIARYALSHLKIQVDGHDCAVSLSRQWIDRHADGAYVALYFQSHCPDAAATLALDYRLFFDIDPSHRAIVVAHQGEATATAVLSPQNARIDLTHAPHASRLP
jgi:hypothetical protein